MQKLRKGLKKGFTLIELLVVIAIIGILATVVIINVAQARTKANNGKVLSDVTNSNKNAAACLADGGTPTAPTTSTGKTAVCSGAGAGIGGEWVELTVASSPSADWAYCTSTTGQDCGTFTGYTAASGSYKFIAKHVSTGEATKYIEMTDTGTAKKGSW